MSTFFSLEHFFCILSTLKHFSHFGQHFSYISHFEQSMSSKTCRSHKNCVPGHKFGVHGIVSKSIQTAAKFSVIRKVLLKDTRNQRNMRRAWLILRKINQISCPSKNARRRGLNGKMQVDQRCLQIYNCIGMSLWSLLCREELRYRKWMLRVSFSRNMATG